MGVSEELLGHNVTIKSSSGTSAHSLGAGLTTTVIMEITNLATASGNMTDGDNLTFVWQQGRAPSTISERARVVLSQPVAVISLMLCALSLVANLLSIVATLLGPCGLVTHLKLVVSLALSDMLLSVSTISHMLNKIFNAVPSHSATSSERLVSACASTFHFALHTMAVVISLLNLLVMALDHYVAIMNPLHYPTRLSRTKGNAIICLVWVVAFLAGCSVFFADVGEFQKVSHHLNYCEYLRYSDYQSEYLVFVVAFVSFFVITYTYGRIYIEVRRTYSRRSTNNVDYVRNRKALLTTLLIIGTFVFCWMPTCLFQIALLIQVHVDKAMVKRMFATLLRANRYLNALLLVNALCDPIIYAFRLKGVQLGYRKLFQKCCCFFFYYYQYRHGSLPLQHKNSSFRSSVMRQTQIVQLPTIPGEVDAHSINDVHVYRGSMDKDRLHQLRRLDQDDLCDENITTAFTCDDDADDNSEPDPLLRVTPMLLIRCVPECGGGGGDKSRGGSGVLRVVNDDCVDGEMRHNIQHYLYNNKHRHHNHQLSNSEDFGDSEMDDEMGGKGDENEVGVRQALCNGRPGVHKACTGELCSHEECTQV